MFHFREEEVRAPIPQKQEVLVDDSQIVVGEDLKMKLYSELWYLVNTTDMHMLSIHV